MKNPLSLFLASLFIVTSCNNSRTNQEKQVEEVVNIINTSTKARIDSVLRSFVESGNVSGISSLIIEKDKEAYFNAFGYADRENNVPMDRKTIVQIFSMTKPITGVALMTLYEKGKFQLDDPISKYAPEFTDMKVYTGVGTSGNMILEPAKRPITIRDLTRHTSGLVYGTDLPILGKLMAEANPLNKENTLKQMAEKLSGLPLVFHPGEQWEYGISVDVQAYMVEQISGQPFAEYVRENVLDPLGMTQTRYIVPESDREHLAAVYERVDEGELNRTPDKEAHDFNTNDWPLKPGGQGLTSTLDDYMRFAYMLINEGTYNNSTLLKPETVKLMATNQLDEDIKERSWLPNKGQVGFGIDFAVRLRPPASAEENNGIVGEFFWDGAASTLFWVDPVNELAAILFTQLRPYDQIKLHKKFRDAVYGNYSQQTSSQ